MLEMPPTKSADIAGLDDEDDGGLDMTDGKNRPNKGLILRKSVDYIRHLQQLIAVQSDRNKELEGVIERMGGIALRPASDPTSDDFPSDEMAGQNDGLIIKGLENVGLEDQIEEQQDADIEREIKVET